MRISAFGLMGLLFDMMFLLDEARHVLSHYQTERSQVLDLLYDYLVHHHSQKVISPYPAADGLSTAYLFQGSNRSVEVSRSSLENVKTLFETPSSFTIIAAVRQELKNVGSILSIGTEQRHYLEVESSGWRSELRFHYAHRSRTRTESFPVNLADNQWHRVALSITGTSHVHVFVDCKLVFERPIPEMKLEVKEWDETHLWIGQRNTRHVYFKGSMEYLKIVTSGEGYLEQCPLANVGCPTCGQFQQLQLSIQQLQSVVVELSKQITRANERILELEECECRKKCKVGDRVYHDGDVVQPEEQCSTCKCKGGAIVCEKVICPIARCENPVIPENECCPVCLKYCFMNGVRHEHGEQFNPKPCYKCICNNGHNKCNKEGRRKCPRLLCPKENQITLPDECCKVCNGSDFCSVGRDLCPANSTCISLQTKFTCQCDYGFTAFGKICRDVDECRAYGGLHGHHCHSNSRCINTVGSYYCECLPGYKRVDQYTCREMDLCEQVGRNVCHAHAQCIDTFGSYVCECAEGYEGDGLKCSLMCPEPCRNGGVCEENGVCRCRLGYKGKNCDADIDECSVGIAACHPNSVCINVPGSYYCQCKDGYHSIREDNENGALCQDLNECLGWGGGSSECPPSTVCQNSNGGYECLCFGNTSCSPGCNFNRKFYNSGEVWQPDNEPCAACQCQHGKVTCENKFVNCSQSVSHTSSSISRQCCLSRHTCWHQELPVVYTTGQKWHYQCSVCECHEGETDCWPVGCPRLGCAAVVYDEGACCPRCSVPDLCSTEPQDSSSSEPMPCVFEGQTMQHKQTWMLDSDRCSSCQCRNGSICCSYDHSCADEDHPGRLPSRQPYQSWRTVPQQLLSTDERSRTTRTSRPRARTRLQERQAEDNG